MGQETSSIALPAGPSAIETAELSDLTFEKPLGGVRLLRTVRARHHNGVVVVKVYTKTPKVPSLKDYAKALRHERNRLRDIPNVLPYARVRETNTSGILVRQYMHSSLYDRISIRPFLEDIEKRWIAFQLLCALEDCHDRQIYHGDIKIENVMVTSWGWVYLTDFASCFKPVYLPASASSIFTNYYDTSARRVCYLAPERFIPEGQVPRENVVQWNMDIFSLGCVLAELFTEVPTFTLTQLLKYRVGEYDPTISLLSKVDDDNVRSMITSMIKRDPSERWHAGDYLEDCKGKAFPLYFYNHLHTLMQEITDPSSGRKTVTANDTNSGESDDRIDRIYEDFEMLSVSLGYQGHASQQSEVTRRPSHLSDLFPMQVDLPNSRHTANRYLTGDSDNGTFILLNVITSSVRSAARSSSKVRACELLLAFAEQVPDEAKLDRVLPYIMPLLDDTHEMVLVAAMRTITQVLALVTVVSPINTFLFTQFVFPRLQNFVKSKGFTQNALVRATYAACLASLAETASRFLDIMQALRAEGSLPSDDKDTEDGVENFASQEAYDATRLEVLEQFEGQTKVFLTDTDTSVRRAFLTSVSSLCVFFGEARAADVILSHLNTYLNDSDWLLKRDFFKTVVGVAVYIGGANLEEFILPVMLQALTDPQEFVVEQALRSLATIAEMGLLQKAKTWELIDIVARFQMHPNIWIKEAAAHFISAATTYLSMADIRILVAPLIEPYLKMPVGALNESELLDALNKPLPRAVLELASQWAGRVDRSAFWRTARESRQLEYHASGQMPPQSSVAELGPRSLARLTKTDEDEQWLGRLRNAGMRNEDEMKLLAFREYLWRSALRVKREEAAETEGSMYEQLISLSKLQIQPQTVIFDNVDVRAYEQRIEQQERTIAEAIEEASRADAKQSAAANGATEASSAEASAVVDGKTTPKLPIPSATRRISGLRSKNSGSLSSSPSSGIGLLGRDVDRALRQRGSPTGLLGGTDLRGKAHAAVATDDATAAGRLDRPRSGSRKASPISRTGDRKNDIDQVASRRAVHNYAGNDPTVLKLLDAVYVDNFPVDTAEFGSFVQPCSGSIPSNMNQPMSGPWRPQGRLVAVLGEHTAKVGCIAVAPDHVFFLTGSDDGTVKVWDTSRLEKNVAHRCRQTYKLSDGAKVTSLCFVDGTHTFICTGSDGSVHAVRVDVTESNASTRYGKFRLVRQWQIPTTGSAVEYAVCSEHYRDSGSILVLATNVGRILAVDLRYMSIIFDFRNPPSHGTPTSFCMGRKHDWLLLGTSHGVLDLWDMRFHFRVRSWTFTNPAPITKVQLHPSRKSSRRNKFCVTGGTAPGEMTVWDAEKAICHEILRPSHSNSKDRLSLRDYELKNLEDDRAEGLLGRVAGSTGMDSVTDSHQPRSETVSFFGAQPSPKDPEAQYPYCLSGGPDGKVRFWDTEKLEGCRIVHGGVPDEKPSYSYGILSQDTRVLFEKLTDDDADQTGGVVESNKVVANPSVQRTSSTAAAAKPLSRYETIRHSARNLLRGHLDVITAVAMVERPFGMVVSADRSGQVFVYR